MNLTATNRLLLGATLLLTLVAAGILIQRNHRWAGNRSPRDSGVEPQAQAFAGYAGSASCRECHQEAYVGWEKSHHGLAERLVQPERDRTAFDPAQTFQHGTQTSSASWSNGVATITAIGLSRQPEPHVIARVIGNDPLRQYLATFPGGRLQALETAHDPHSHQWFNIYGNEDRQPGEWGHWTGRGMNWNSSCATCHNTRLRKNYNETTDSYRTAMAERSVGCEACHGPLQKHNDWQKQFGKSGQLDPTLIPRTQKQTLDTCGQCHSRRAELTGDFVPGDDFQDHFDLNIVDGSDIYFPDGQVRDENYEFASFLSSRMHEKGVSCGNCHQPHTAKIRLPGNSLCLQCHSPGSTNAPVIDPVAHSHHRVRGYSAEGKLIENDLTKFATKQFPETGGECVNCHMPQTTYMQRHARHDHGFTIPDPLLTKEFGIPNACNRCHQDKSVDWALETTKQWYGNRMERPSRRRAQTFARARAGDATAIPSLLELLAGNETPFWKAAAINLLASWAAEPSVQTALLHNITHSNALVRTKAVRAVESSMAQPTAKVEAILRARLSDEIRSVRIAAAWALRATLETTNAAARELNWQLDHNADQPVGQMQKGAFLVARTNPPQALVHYRKAATWDENSAPIRHDLAMVYSMLNRNRDALAELRNAVRLDPNEAEYRYKLALAWHEAGDAKQTIAELENAVRLNPRHVRAWYNLGLAREANQDFTNALPALEQAEVLDPTNPEFPYARAAILQRLGRPFEARAAAERALKLNPEGAR